MINKFANTEYNTKQAQPSWFAARLVRWQKRLFEKYGPHLIFKRDNAGNLNHEAVNALLNEYQVMILNSPCHYPQYNGGIERLQRYIKKHLGHLAAGKWSSMAFLE